VFRNSRTTKKPVGVKNSIHRGFFGQATRRVLRIGMMDKSKRVPQARIIPNPDKTGHNEGRRLIERAHLPRMPYP